jgi:hypothetical protein
VHFVAVHVFFSDFTCEHRVTPASFAVGPNDVLIDVNTFLAGFHVSSSAWSSMDCASTSKAWQLANESQSSAPRA